MSFRGYVTVQAPKTYEARKMETSGIPLSQHYFVEEHGQGFGLAKRGAIGCGGKKKERTKKLFDKGGTRTHARFRTRILMLRMNP